LNASAEKHNRPLRHGRGCRLPAQPLPVASDPPPHDLAHAHADHLRHGSGRHVRRPGSARGCTRRDRRKDEGDTEVETQATHMRVRNRHARMGSTRRQRRSGRSSIRQHRCVSKVYRTPMGERAQEAADTDTHTDTHTPHTHAQPVEGSGQVQATRCCSAHPTWVACRTGERLAGLEGAGRPETLRCRGSADEADATHLRSRPRYPPPAPPAGGKGSRPRSSRPRSPPRSKSRGGGARASRSSKPRGGGARSLYRSSNRSAPPSRKRSPSRPRSSRP
jgi:hypothetical protein